MLLGGCASGSTQAFTAKAPPQKAGFAIDVESKQTLDGAIDHLSDRLQSNIDHLSTKVQGNIDSLDGWSLRLSKPATGK